MMKHSVWSNKYNRQSDRLVKANWKRRRSLTWRELQDAMDDWTLVDGQPPSGEDLRS